jgi:hypothetical protein
MWTITMILENGSEVVYEKLSGKKSKEVLENVVMRTETLKKLIMENVE